MCCNEQRIIFNGKQLGDEELLSLAGVEEESTLYILGRLMGGAKKRKKKTYTKPKKQKHKHKKIKLRVLKFYKVRNFVLSTAGWHLDWSTRESIFRTMPAGRFGGAHCLFIFILACMCLSVQVDDSGKVQRLRKQCPNCGPGTFMATHFDRVYCGKCTTTFLYEKEAAGAKGGKGKN